MRKQTTIQDLGVRDMLVEDKYLGIFPLKSDHRIASYDFLTVTSLDQDTLVGDSTLPIMQVGLFFVNLH